MLNEEKVGFTKFGTRRKYFEMTPQITFPIHKSAFGTVMSSAKQEEELRNLIKVNIEIEKMPVY